MKILRTIARLLRRRKPPKEPTVIHENRRMPMSEAVEAISSKF